MTSVAKDLEEAGAKRWYVWAECKRHTIQGFVLGYSDSLVLFHRFIDFFDDGYVVVRRDLLDSICHKSRSLEFFEKMMGWEGVLDRVGIDFDVPLDSVTSVLRTMLARDEMVLIDAGESDEEGEVWTVGKILEVSESSVRVRPISALCEWWDDDSLDTSEIERVEFNTRYLRAFNKYAAPRPDGPQGGSTNSAKGGARASAGKGRKGTLSRLGVEGEEP